MRPRPIRTTLAREYWDVGPRTSKGKIMRALSRCSITLRRLGLVTALLSCLGVPFASAAHAEQTWAEQEGHYGVNTFTDYHNASGEGTPIAAAAWVNVSCKVYDPTIASVNPDGYWYRIASSPWDDQYYSPANTFMNGDPWNGPYTHNTDFSVPDCDTLTTPTPTVTTPPSNPSVSLAQGPTAPAGYRYAITLSGFAASTSVSITCYDSVSTNGFYTFSLTTDGSGNAFTDSYCYSGDGPEHWVIAGGVESNQVAWGGGSTTPTVTTGTTTSTSSPVSVPVNSFYYREQATDWALANAEDIQPTGDACTWFVSQALWAGGFPKSSTWTDAGGHWLTLKPPTWVDGTAAAWTVPLLVNYLLDHFPYTYLRSLGRLSKEPAVLAQAVPGDVIIYSWGGNSKMNHMALVVPTKPGQTATQVAAWTELRAGTSSQTWKQRAWNWSAKNNEPITSEYSGATAWLLHIDGGFWVSSY